TLSLAGEYSFKIVVCNPQNAGCGSSKNLVVTAVLPAPGVPGQPGTVGSAYIPVNTDYILSWTAASGSISRYELLEDNIEVYSGEALSESLNYSNYGKRLYKVRACNESNCGDYSELRSIVLYTAPGPAANYTVSKSSVAVGENVTLNWEVAGGSVPGATYHVTTTLPGGGSSIEQTTELSMNKTLSLAGEYSFKIVVCNPQNAGCGSSEIVSVISTLPEYYSSISLQVNNVPVSEVFVGQEVNINWDGGSEGTCVDMNQPNTLLNIQGLKSKRFYIVGEQSVLWRCTLSNNSVVDLTESITIKRLLSPVNLKEQ
ncbi:hypothetical protein, partial [Paraglaciecola sp.]|uniref:hypothetical protein n=1 Tax=Paraglaciecola sp. TaxID=1920173 RepID=UPI003EF9634B